METAERLTPVFQHPYQESLSQLRGKFVLGQISDAQPADRGIGDMGSGVEYQLASYPHFQLLALALEFPRVHAVIGGEAYVDAAMCCQIARMFGSGVSGEVTGRCHDRHSYRRADGHGNHVLGHRVTEAHAGIEAVGDDIAKAIVDIEFQLDIRIHLQQWR